MNAINATGCRKKYSKKKENPRKNWGLKQEIPQAKYYVVRSTRATHRNALGTKDLHTYGRLLAVYPRAQYYLSDVPSSVWKGGYCYTFAISSKAMHFRSRKQAETVKSNLEQNCPGIKYEVVGRSKPYRQWTKCLTFREAKVNHLRTKLSKLVKTSDIHSLGAIVCEIDNMAAGPLADAFLDQGNKTVGAERERLHTIADVILNLQRCFMEQRAAGLKLFSLW